MSFGYYADPEAHLDGELGVLRARLAHRIALRKATDTLVAGLDPDVQSDDADVAAAAERLRMIEQAHDLRLQVSAEMNVALPLPELVRRTHLDAFAASLLTTAILVELDGGVRRALSHLQGDPARVLDLELALELFGADRAERRAGARDALDVESPLMLFRLLALPRDAKDDDFSLMRAPLKAPRRVVDHALGRDRFDPAIRDALKMHVHRGPPVESAGIDLLVDPATERNGQGARRAFLDLVRRGIEAMLVISGPPGAGKTTFARNVARGLGLGVVEVKAAALAGLGDAASRIGREGILAGALPLIAESTGTDQERDAITALIGSIRGPVILETRRPMPITTQRPVVAMTLATPDAKQRTMLWRGALSSAGLPGDDADELGIRHRITGGAIWRAVDLVRYRAQHLDASGRREAFDQMLADERQHKLAELATPVRSRPTWDALVVQSSTKDELETLISHYRHRRQVFVEWGFDRSLATGRGISALFEGPPGTGKTYAAGLIAREFDLELWQVDVSKIVSKWIGETEKNLATLFDEGEKAHAILLFDEADSLFSKRTEVKSSNDRHANLEVNFLLQRMDQYPGICLLTTNFGAAIDEAFARRLTTRVTFPAPNEVERRRLWNVLLPPDLPRAPGLAFDRLAKDFELTGGHIRNAVLKAAVAAARAQAPVDEAMLRDAARQEYRALGKIVRDEV